MKDPGRPWPARILRWIAALALFPPSLGVSWAVIDLVSATGGVFRFWIPFASGCVCWLVVYFSLPRPMWLYVVGHELTHALWALLFGAKVSGFKATGKGGHVVVSKSNSLIVLAPYFFPLYAVLWTALFLVAGIWLDLRGVPLMAFHVGLGIAYAFHVSLTLQVLRTGQSDLRSEGWFFSLMLVWFAHAVVLLLAIPLLTHRVGVLPSVGWAVDRTGRILSGIARLR